MTQTLYNGAEVFTNGDNYNLSEDMVKLCLSLNITIPVPDIPARDTLASLAPGGVLPLGTEVVITGDTTLPKQKWNGTKWVQFIYAEASASILVQPAEAWGSGQLTVSGANSTDTTFVTFPVPDCIQFTQPGLYSVSTHMKLTTVGATVSGFTKATLQSEFGQSVYGQEYPAVGATECVVSAPVIYFPTAGGRVFVKFFQNNGAAQTWSTLARISKIG